MITCRTVWTV